MSSRKQLTRGIEEVGGAKKGKAIIILNPAEPPIFMRIQFMYRVEDEAKQEEIVASIRKMEQEVKSYVPGYRIRQEPIFDGQADHGLIEVEGAGDYLPTYSGNLDIMTAAAVKMAEEWAKHRVANVPV